MNPLVIISWQVKAKTCGICEENAALSIVLYNCAACDNIKLWQHSVFQSNGNIGGSVFEIYFKGLRFGAFRIYGGKSVYRILAVRYFVAGISQIKRTATVGMYGRYCAYPVIPYTCAGVFERESVEGIGAAVSCFVDITRKANIGIFAQILHAHADPFAIP